MNLFDYVTQISVSVVVFLILVFLERFLIEKIKNNQNTFLNPNNYLPEEEIKTLKQLYYLIMALLLFIIIIDMFFDNDIILTSNPSLYSFNSALDIIISTHIASIVYDKSSNRRKLLFVFIMPIASIAFLLFGPSLIEALDLLRIPAFIFLMKYFYDKFKSYSEKHQLGFSIILLFSIISISIIFTIIIEKQEPLNAIVMVSNAFTSNGYAILGDTTGGKVNSIILVWSGYILSGAATATLTVAILSQAYHKKFNRYNEKIDELEKSLESIDEKLDELQKSLKEFKK